MPVIIVWMICDTHHFNIQWNTDTHPRHYIIMTASSISKHSYLIQIKIISCPNSTTFRSPVVIFPSFWTSRMSSDLDSKLQTHELICLKKQTGQSPRRLRVKESSKHLWTQTSLLPCVNKERFKASFINRLYFKYTFTF